MKIQKKIIERNFNENCQHEHFLFSLVDKLILILS